MRTSSCDSATGATDGLRPSSGGPRWRRGLKASSVSGRRIVESDGLEANGQVAVLVHELAHVHGARYQDLGRAGGEVVAETAAFVALPAVRLDTAGQSVPWRTGRTPRPSRWRPTRRQSIASPRSSRTASGFRSGFGAESGCPAWNVRSGTSAGRPSHGGPPPTVSGDPCRAVEQSHLPHVAVVSRSPGRPESHRGGKA